MSRWEMLLCACAVAAIFIPAIAEDQTKQNPFAESQSADVSDDGDEADLDNSFGFGRYRESAVPSEEKRAPSPPGKAIDKPAFAPIVVESSSETAARERLEAELDRQTKLDCTETPLSDVVSYLYDYHGHVEFQLDLKALEDASIGPDTPVTRKLEGITLRAALRLLLEPLDLAYIIRDEVILITTRAKADSTLVTKIYPVGDLVAPETSGKKADDYQSLIKVVRASVPLRTSAQQPAGSVMALPQARSLVVVQNDEAHERVAELLDGLRKAQSVKYNR